MVNILEKQQIGSGVEVLEEPQVVDGYWRVPVRWGNGSVTISNFPESGFEVFDDGGDGKSLGKINGKDAVEFLKKHSQEYDDVTPFKWKYYFENKK